MLTTLLLIAIGLLAAPPTLAACRSLIVIPLRLWLGAARPAAAAAPRDWPPVTVQLAIYRESVVLERLLRSILAIDYPRDRMRIQIVDDSEADDAERSRAIVAMLASQGVTIDYLQRPKRVGYKAGALNFGMAQIDDELIAFFDADFEARPDFLKTLVPAFDDPSVGGIQARWDYMNDTDRPVTQMQAGVFDKMFSFEIDVRSRLGRPALFLGSNGMFRRAALNGIGGWKEQPFTSEDLDVSYRIHVAGWKLLYEPRPLGLTELPETYLPYLQQQRRWARGMTRVFLDHVGTMLTTRRQRLLEYLEGSLIVFQVGMPFVALLPLVMLAYVGLGLERNAAWAWEQALLFIGIVTPPVMIEVLVAQKVHYADWRSRARRVLQAAPLAMGLAVSMLAGVFETLTASQGEFVRTPKQGQLGIVRNSVGSWLRGFLPVLAAQWTLAAACAITVALAAWRGYWEVLPLMVSMGSGFFISAAHASAELRRKSRTAAAAQAAVAKA
ncbi:MAG: glycosyltransferase [Proteobacteria bacterium]|nr:glycosyltransferase [Pseudomonadota bacterium]